MQQEEKPASGAPPQLLPVVLAPREGVFEKIRRRMPAWAGGVVSVALFAAAALLLSRVLSNISFAGLGAALAETSAVQIFKALGLTFLSYLALTGYDVLALRHIEVSPPFRTVAVASYSSCAISFNLGFPIVTSAAVRYLIYSRVQMTALHVAKIAILAGVTFWLGMTLMLGVGLIGGAAEIAEVDGLPTVVHYLLGGLIVAGIIAYCVWTATAQRRVTIRGHELELPRLPLTLAQLAISVVDICAAAGALYVLLPTGVDMGFLPFAAAYVFACVLGAVSHAPGGIGVFEATMLHAIPGAPQENLLAALLLFRVIYYFLPFVIALAMLGAGEVGRRWTSLREVVARIIEERAI